MPYLKVEPCRALQPFIESIWVQEDLRNAAHERFAPTQVLPTGSIEVAFCYLNPFAEVVHDQRIPVPRSAITGQKSRRKAYLATGQTGVIVVRFKPWGASAFFSCPLSDVADRNVDLNLLVPSAAIGALEERLQETSELAFRIQLIESFLLKSLRADQIDQLVVQCAKRIASSSGSIRIAALASDFKISQRQLERRFARSVGMSPKRFSNIMRFQKALALKRQGLAWFQIAEQCSYFDQAHYIKEFQRFSGFPPQQLFLSLSSTPLARFFNAGSDSSLFYNTIYL